MTEPSWLKFIGGRDNDRGNTIVFLYMFRGGSIKDLTDAELAYYLECIDRLAMDQYPAKPAHRTADPSNFWIALHYLLSVQNGMSEKTAGDETGALAGLSRKTVQAHARKHRKAVLEYVEHCWRTRAAVFIRVNLTEENHRGAMIHLATKVLPLARRLRK